MSYVRKEELAEGIVLIQGDCLEVLPTLGRFDAVVTDIPYEISQKSNGLRRLDYGTWDASGATGVAFAALDLLSGAPSMLAWCSAGQISKLHDKFPDRQRRTLVWTKPNPPVLNGQHLFLSSQELGFFGKKDRAWFKGGCVLSYWHGTPPQDRDHPTQKPEALMKWCVANTVAPGAAVVDPFMGSGTTGVACAKLGRKFTGIEIDGGYFDIAVRRIAAALKEPDLFVDPPKPVHQLSILDGDAA